MGSYLNKAKRLPKDDDEPYMATRKHAASAAKTKVQGCPRESRRRLRVQRQVEMSDAGSVLVAVIVEQGKQWNVLQRWSAAKICASAQEPTSIYRHCVSVGRTLAATIPPRSPLAQFLF